MFEKYHNLLYYFSLFLITGIVHASSQKIWIDTDIAIGKFGHDVDDGIALIMALQAPQVEIIGISLVSNPKYGYKVCQRILNYYGNPGDEFPVYKGAKRANQLGNSNEAVRALAEALTREKLTIIALGPATNIASVLLLYPELKDQIIQIIWCAGRRPFSHFNPGKGKINVCDCNFDHSTTAGKILLASGVHVVLSGYESASSIYISMNDIMPLKESDYKPDKWLYQQLRSWLKIWSFFLGSEGFIPFDAVTIGSFLYPNLTSISERVPALIEDHPNDSLSIFKRRKLFLVVSPDLVSTSEVDYCSMIDLEFKDEMLQLLLNRRPGHR
ncbi:MAG: nucleoside hydrolase [Saprospiraceae bacterium]|nr:nucleoside hydrolase [Saprospiraceae bacterium]